MKSNHKKVLFIAQTLALLALIETPIFALTDAKESKYRTESAKAATEHKPASKGKKVIKDKEEENSTAVSSLVQDKLVLAAQAFQERQDDSTYNTLWDCFVTFAQQTTAKHKDPAFLLRSWKILLQAGLKVIEPAGANSATHIYVFNHMPQNNYTFVPQNKSALIQWADQSAVETVAETTGKGKQKKWHPKKTKSIAIIKTQSFSLPGSVDIREATLLPHAEVVVKTAVIKSKNKSKRGIAKDTAKTKVVKLVSPSRPHVIAVSGTDTQSGHMWIFSLKQSAGSWLNYPELFQDIPPFLLQSSATKAKFSGNNLVLSMGGSSGYELVMPLVDERFAFSTKEAQDSASAVAHQFLMALQYKRAELAKVWLVDPKLASIPGYLGLYSRPSDSPAMRLISMPQPICGGSRFRLITGGKDDLILDVAKIKGQLLIKAIFIAPANSSSSLISKASQVKVLED